MEKNERQIETQLKKKRCVVIFGNVAKNQQAGIVMDKGELNRTKEEERTTRLEVCRMGL